MQIFLLGVLCVLTRAKKALWACRMCPSAWFSSIVGIHCRATIVSRITEQNVLSSLLEDLYDNDLGLH
jgi:hypothetical protein